MIYHFIFILLFMLGLYAILTKKTLIKTIIGLNIIETSVFFWVMAVNYREGIIPILNKTVKTANLDVVNPLPQALVLTGIVIGASTTAFLLTLIIEISKFANNIKIETLKGLRD